MEREWREFIVEKLNLEFYYGREAEQFTFYKLPKALITDERYKDISNNAKLLYGLMHSRMEYSKRRGWIDENNRVYIKYSLNNIEENLNISRKTAAALLKELCHSGLIEMIQQSGCANVIYVKNFISDMGSNDTIEDNGGKNDTGEKTTPVENIDRCINSTSVKKAPVGKINQCNIGSETGGISAGVLGEKLPSNKINNRITNKESDNSIDRSERKIDEIDADAYMELIRNNIDYDIAMQNSDLEEREMFEELYQLICEVVCVPRKTIKIAGENYPYGLVKGKFLTLNAEHLQYVIGCVKKNTVKINNIKAYLITALYNAPSTISHYYMAEVNHDLYGLD